MKRFAAALAIFFGLFFASTHAFASCACQTPPPPPPPCGCHQHHRVHHHPIVHLRPPVVEHVRPMLPPPPVAEPYRNPCGVCGTARVLPPPPPAAEPYRNPCGVCGTVRVLPPPPPAYERFNGPCGACNRDGMRRGERCWQIPVTNQYGQILYFKRECD